MGTLEDIARMALFLASPQASGMTGAIPSPLWTAAPLKRPLSF